MAASELGLNMEITLAADSNTDALSAYQSNFSEVINNFLGTDLSSVFSPLGNALSPTESKIADTAGHVDMLMAGPPCQGHSSLNNSTRRLDPRNELYFVVPRAVEILKPSFVIIENVPEIVHSKEKVVQKTKNFLDSIGYYNTEIVISFDKIGIPQKRKRHILLASKNSMFTEITDSSFKPQNDNTLSAWLKDIKIYDDSILDRTTKISDDNQTRIDYLFANDLYDLPNEMRPPCHRDKKHSYKSVYGRLRWDQPAQTITSGFGSMGQGRYIHPSERRPITAREAMRIQGFPDWYNFDAVDSITSIRKLIANAVPPILTYSILMYIDQLIHSNPTKIIESNELNKELS